MRVFIGGKIDSNLVDIDSGLQLIALWTQSDFKWIGGGEPTTYVSQYTCKYSVHVNVSI